MQVEFGGKKFEGRVLKPEYPSIFYPDGYGVHLRPEEDGVRMDQAIRADVDGVVDLVRKYGAVIVDGIGVDVKLNDKRLFWQGVSRQGFQGLHGDAPEGSHFLMGMDNAKADVSCLYQIAGSQPRDGATYSMPADLFWQSQVLGDRFGLSSGTVMERLKEACDSDWQVNFSQLILEDVDLTRRILAAEVENVLRVGWAGTGDRMLLLDNDLTREAEGESDMDPGVRRNLHPAPDDLLKFSHGMRFAYIGKGRNAMGRGIWSPPPVEGKVEGVVGNYYYFD